MLSNFVYFVDITGRLGLDCSHWYIDSNRMKTFITIGLVGLLLAGGSFIYKYQKYNREPVPVAVDVNTLIKQNSQQENSSAVGQSSQEIFPPNLNLKMTFYAQAPFGDWSLPWQEACEEASVLLVANTYFNKNWTREQFRDEIIKLVDWENQKFGDYKHTSMDQTAQILNEYLGLKTKIHTNPTYADIQKILNQGHLIIMPFAGRRLGNPFYTNGGPIYHVFVIKGYKEDQKIISEDVGTRRGEDYVYSWGVMYNALHDYAVPIESGAKRIIEVIPPN